MSNIDPEVLYLILTKVAAKESFYSYDPARLPAGQPAGTITKEELGALYERITGNRVGSRLNWAPPLGQLNGLLLRCGLPPVGEVVLAARPAETAPAALSASLAKVHATKWPPFSGLKDLYRKGGS
jgi:hypothetical protein